MEFIESISLLHLQLRLLDSNFSNNLSYFKNNPKIHNLNYPKDIDKDYHDHHEHLKTTVLKGLNFNNTPHYNMLSSSSMAAYSSQLESEVTTWSSATEQTTIDEATILDIPVQGIIDEYPLRLSTWGIVILVIGYLVVFIFGVVGNCCVLFIVVRLRKMKTVTNYFIFSLAISDLLVLLFCLLPNLVSNIYVPWILGWFLCKTVPYIQGISVCSSIYFLVAISVERCICIQCPFKFQITKERAKLIILGIVAWSCLVALPWALFFQSGNFDPNNSHLEFCIEVWPKKYKNWGLYYFLFGNLFLCYLLPLGVICICYLTIWFRVYRRSVPSNCYQKAVELIHQRSKTAVIKMFIVVVLIFALSWLPLYVIIIRIKFGQDLSESESYLISLLFPLAQWLGCFNSCINPIIYSFYNLKFRNAFLSIIGRDRRQPTIKIKHKSSTPQTVNILLKRLTTIQYRVETTTNNIDDSSESI